MTGHDFNEFASRLRALASTDVRRSMRRILDPWGGPSKVRVVGIPAGLTRAGAVADRLTERMIKKWHSEGDIVRCGFGRYRKP